VAPQAVARASETFVHDAGRQLPAPKDEALGDAMEDHIPLIHAEVQERLRPVIIEDKDRRLLGFGSEGQSRVHAIIRRGHRLKGRIATEPILYVLRPVSV
jgi:hypothetical protein